MVWWKAKRGLFLSNGYIYIYIYHEVRGNKSGSGGSNHFLCRQECSCRLNHVFCPFAKDDKYISSPYWVTSKHAKTVTGLAKGISDGSLVWEVEIRLLLMMRSELYKINGVRWDQVRVAKEPEWSHKPHVTFFLPVHLYCPIPLSMNRVIFEL